MLSLLRGCLVSAPKVSHARGADARPVLARRQARRRKDRVGVGYRHQEGTAGQGSRWDAASEGFVETLTEGHIVLFQNRELQIMRLVAHPNVVDLKAFFYSSGDKVRAPTWYTAGRH